MLVIIILVFALSGAMMLLFEFMVLHLKKVHPFLKKHVRIEVKTAFQLSDKTDVDGYPLYEINGKLQKIPSKAVCKIHQKGAHACDAPLLYIHLNGTVDAEKRHDEVVISESIMLLEGDYVIQTKKELKFYKQYRNLVGWTVLMILLVSASLDLLILLPW